MWPRPCRPPERYPRPSPTPLDVHPVDPPPRRNTSIGIPPVVGEVVHQASRTRAARRTPPFPSPRPRRPRPREKTPGPPLSKAPSSPESSEMCGSVRERARAGGRRGELGTFEASIFPPCADSGHGGGRRADFSLGRLLRVAGPGGGVIRPPFSLRSHSTAFRNCSCSSPSASARPPGPHRIRPPGPLPPPRGGSGWMAPSVFNVLWKMRDHAGRGRRKLEQVVRSTSAAEPRFTFRRPTGFLAAPPTTESRTARSGDREGPPWAIGPGTRQTVRDGPAPTRVSAGNYNGGLLEFGLYSEGVIITSARRMGLDVKFREPILRLAAAGHGLHALAAAGGLGPPYFFQASTWPKRDVGEATTVADRGRPAPPTLTTCARASILARLLRGDGEKVEEGTRLIQAKSPRREGVGRSSGGIGGSEKPRNWIEAARPPNTAHREDQHGPIPHRPSSGRIGKAAQLAIGEHPCRGPALPPNPAPPCRLAQPHGCAAECLRPLRT